MARSRRRTSSGRATRTVVFLGAGASAPLGFPTTDEILPAIWRGLHDGSWKRWAGLRSSPRPHADARQLKKLLTVLLPGLKSQREWSSGASIIDVLSLLDQLIVENRVPSPELSENWVRRARALLQLGINAVLQGRQSLELRNRLVEWLLSESVQHPGNRVTLISTNYDTAVEKRLFDRLIELRRSVGQNVDFGTTWRDAFRNLLHVRPRAARLAVYKLHGSLNWLRCETCGHISINVRQRIASLEFWVRLRDQNTCQCGGRLRSVLVTPSVVRDVRDASLLSIWNAAVEDLRKAHRWIFIGYSLPSEDIAIRSLLLRAFNARAKKSTLKIQVVQRESPSRDGKTPVTRARYRMFFPGEHLDQERDYFTEGFEQYVGTLQSLPTKTVNARLTRLLPRVTLDWLRPRG